MPPITLDVFNQDAFSARSLTASVLKMPFKPGRIGALGLFLEEGMSTVTAQIEELDGQLSLIQTSQRGAPGDSIGSNRRKVRPFNAVHLEKNSTVYADQVQGVRAFGSDNALQGVQDLVNQRLATLRAMHEVTLEYHRAKAIQGIVLDADGAEILDLFDAFEVSQNTADFPTGGTDLRDRVLQVLRVIDGVLGADPVTEYRAFCGTGFFDNLIDHPQVQETLKYQEGRVLAADLRKGFDFGGVTWEEYRGSVGGTSFFPSAKAYVYPVVQGLFRTWWAPADFEEAVNTLGLPIYAKQAPDKFNRYREIHTQSNPLVLCTRPGAVVEVEFRS